MLTINKELADRMRIPLDFREAEFGSISEPARGQIARFLADPSLLDTGVGMFFSGGLGTGKSCAAAVALQLIARRGKRGLFVRADDLPSYFIKETMFDEDTTYEARMESVDVLVLDELKIKAADTFKDNLVETITRRRLENRKSMIVTTNLTPRQLSAEFPSLADLFWAHMLTIRFAGKNFRLEQANDIQKVFNGRIS